MTPRRLPKTIAPPGHRRRPGSQGFVLLEVTLAVVILGIAAAVALRSFVLSMHATRELEISLRATLLAQTMMETFDLVPPHEGKLEGSFGADPNFGKPYEFYFYRMEVEDETIDYDHVSLEGARRDMVPFTKVHLEIWYDDQRNRVFRPVNLYTYVIRDDPFSPVTRQANQLF